MPSFDIIEGIYGILCGYYGNLSLRRGRVLLYEQVAKRIANMLEPKKKITSRAEKVLSYK